MKMYFEQAVFPLTVAGFSISIQIQLWSVWKAMGNYFPHSITSQCWRVTSKDTQDGGGKRKSKWVFSNLFVTISHSYSILCDWWDDKPVIILIKSSTAYILINTDYVFKYSHNFLQTKIKLSRTQMSFPLFHAICFQTVIWKYMRIFHCKTCFWWECYQQCIYY